MSEEPADNAKSNKLPFEGAIGEECSCGNRKSRCPKCANWRESYKKHHKQLLGDWPEVREYEACKGKDDAVDMEIEDIVE